MIILLYRMAVFKKKPHEMVIAASL